MRKVWLIPLFVAFAGCAARDGSDVEIARDELATNGSSELFDNVEVAPDRLIFSPRLRHDGAELGALVERVTRYQQAYEEAAAHAPATARDPQALDRWVTEHLRERGIAPVILVGKRQSDAVNPDGTIRTDVPNPNGYLRRAIAVSVGEGGETVFVTKKATIAEASEELHAAGFLRGDGCYPQQVHPFRILNVDLSKTLYEKHFSSLGTMRISLADSYVTLDGKLDTQVLGACLDPTVAHGILTADLKGQIVLVGAFDGAFGATTGDQQLYYQRYDIASAAGYPLALDFTVSGTCDFSSTGKVRASVGAKMSGTLRGGVTYDETDGADTFFEPSWPRFGHVGPTFDARATIDAKCEVRVRARALVFDNDDGPEIGVSSFVGLDASAAAGSSRQVRAKVTAGVEAGIGGKLESFGFTIIDDISVPLHSQRWTLLDRNVTISP